MLNRIKKTIAMIFAACLCVAVLPAIATADEGALLQPGELSTQAGLYPSGTSGTCTWTLYNDGHLVIEPTDGVEGTLDMSDLPSMHKASVTAVSFNGTVHAAARFRMLAGCTALEIVDFTGFDMSGITNMSEMFSGCASLVSVDLSGKDTSNVLSMENVFANCTALTTVKLTDLNFSKVTTMRELFYNCPSLTSVIISEWNTPALGSTISMFHGCSSLQSVNLVGLDTSNVTYMNRMFAGCSALSSLNLSGLDTSHVTSMISMFEGCEKLETLNVSSFNTMGVRSMKGMFADCSSLESLDLSNFNTPLLTSTESMFSGCSLLESLDLSGLNMSLVQSADSGFMFAGCTSLAQIKLGKNVTNLTSFPAGSTGYWVSESENAVLSVDEILSQRQGIADTYTEVPAANSLVNAEMAVTPAEVTYTGQELRPSVEVTLSGKVLTADVDYTLTYKNNVEIGTATVVARGKGDYVGKNEATFAIVAAPPADEDPITPDNPDDPGSGSGADSDDPGKADEGGSQDKPSGDSSGSGADKSTDAKPSSSDEPNPGPDTPSDGDAGKTADESADLPAEDDLLKQAGAANKAGFTDLAAGAWYMSVPDGAFPNTNVLYLDYAVGKGLMSGYTGDRKGEFGPDDKMSRAMAATIIYRMANEDISATIDEQKYEKNDSGLRDVEDRAYYTAAVNWAVKSGVITGYTDGSGRFGPNDNVTREQLAVMIYRYCVNIAGMKDAGNDVSAFPDDNSISDWALQGAAFCNAHGIITGYSHSGEFDPSGFATRCQMAKIIAVTAHMLA